MVLFPTLNEPLTTNYPEFPIQTFDFHSLRFCYLGHNEFARRKMAFCHNRARSLRAGRTQEPIRSIDCATANQFPFSRRSETPACVAAARSRSLKCCQHQTSDSAQDPTAS